MGSNDRRGNFDDMATERELLYKILFDMRNDINDLKRMMTEAMSGRERTTPPTTTHSDVIGLLPERTHTEQRHYDYADIEVVDDVPAREMTKEDMQREQIVQALQRNNYSRKEAARELFISERTLYRRMKALGIDDNSK